MNGLSDKDIRHFKERLTRRRDELRATLELDAATPPGQNFSETVGHVRDPGEEAVAVQESDLQISGMEKQQRWLAEVEDALARIGEGTYGECRDCGGDVPRDRLEAYPTATRCTQCQARVENRRGGRDATPTL